MSVSSEICKMCLSLAENLSRDASVKEHVRTFEFFAETKNKLCKMIS